MRRRESTGQLAIRSRGAAGSRYDTGHDTGRAGFRPGGRDTSSPYGARCGSQDRAIPPGSSRDLLCGCISGSRVDLLAQDKLWSPAGIPAFHPALSRDDVEHDKPHPAALEAIARKWNQQLGSGLLMVGDSPSNDIGFGKAAGVSTALVDPRRRFRDGDSSYGADVVIDSLLELPQLLWKTFDIPGPLGSTSAQTLARKSEPLPETAACRAAVDGDIAALKAMAREDLLAADSSGNTPLVWAADAGKADAVESLLAAGVEVNVKGYLGNTAVSRACRRGHDSVLRVLLRSGTGVDLDEPNEKMQSPLHFAAFKQKTEAVKLMLAAGASTTSLDRKGRTPAEDTSDPNIRELILQARASL
ncbi:ANKRD52 [Symbiodinium necroappetens]|uniref:ANKRD52 protein n=1 Tax=Symbiodinium necroappetens TaxID=1628268 RepID=A0A813CDM8_9DINO|nr:ANKRD52 [Symbiodinium necroappetens]